jgi:hypothetical protein
MQWPIDTCAASGVIRCAGSPLHGLPDGDLHRRIIAILPIELQRLGWMKRWLRHETRCGTAVHLSCVDEEGMTQIDGARFAGGQCLWSFGSHPVQNQMGHARIAGGFEKPRHVEMRSEPDSYRSVQLTDVGEQEQHKQSAIARSYVHTPVRKILSFVRITGFTGKTDVDMPTRVTGIIQARKAYRKAAEVRTRTPTAVSDKLIESGMEQASVRHFPEWLLVIVSKSNDRFRPRCRIVGIAPGVPPQDGAALVGQFSGKRSVDPDKSVFNKLLYLLVAERAHWFTFSGHENSHYRLAAHRCLARQDR